MSAVHPEPGLRVGDRYVLTERIAGGGMGEVWRALDDVLGREVAVKLLRREYADDDAFLTRFRAEARHAASLSHPGIASVYDYGEVEGVAYLVMELVNGEPLSTRLAREGALPAAVAVPLLQQAAAALQAAHDGGLVHRDVKPANLLLTPDDQVKITDFGIARAGDQAPITRTGEVMGTAQYLSPEQAMGRLATPASDVYALGVVAYEALSGRRPFDGDSMVATAMAQVNDAPDPLPAFVPPAVATVVLRALAKDPAQRPASAAAMGAALGEAMTASGSTGALGADATQAMSAADAALLVGVPTAASGAGLAGQTAALPVVDGPGTGGTSTVGTGTLLAGEPRRRSRLAWVLGVLGVLLVVALAALAISQLGDDGNGTPASTGTSTSTTSSTSATSRSSSETSSQTSSQTSSETSSPTTITLDPGDYVGRDEKDVRNELEDLGLKTRSDKQESSEDKGTVLSLSPTEGLSKGDTVTLRVSDGKAQDTPTDTPTGTPTATGTGTGTESVDAGGAAATTSPTSPTSRSTGAAKASPTATGEQG